MVRVAPFLTHSVQKLSSCYVLSHNDAQLFRCRAVNAITSI